MMKHTQRLQATSRHGCCDAVGRMVMLAQQPTTLERLVLIAEARGEGTRGEIMQRVADMLANGLLIELDDHGSESP